MYFIKLILGIYRFYNSSIEQRLRDEFPLIYTPKKRLVQQYSTFLKNQNKISNRHSEFLGLNQMLISIFFRFIVSTKKPIYNSTDRVFVGSVSTEDNPFWSQIIPGIHYCDEQFDSQYEYQIYHTFGERQYLVPFNLTNSDEYHHCDYLISKESEEKMKAIAKGNSYLRFYYNNIWKGVRFSTTENNTLHYFTTYSITVFDKFNFSIFPSHPAKSQKDPTHPVPASARTYPLRRL